ncbi:unnamed protein product [Rangifer tarandus platyrhynchus]|uniref:Uncharacterized protein n=1 Tax=Rangifer tarandus platyrhynchus TaxID=3082113 RepID=A0AC59YW77_RANTA
MWPVCGDHSFPLQTGVPSGQAQEDNALSAPSSSGRPSAHAQTEAGSRQALRQQAHEHRLPRLPDGNLGAHAALGHGPALLLALLFFPSSPPCQPSVHL